MIEINVIIYPERVTVMRGEYEFESKFVQNTSFKILDAVTNDYKQDCMFTALLTPVEEHELLLSRLNKHRKYTVIDHFANTMGSEWYNHIQWEKYSCK